MEAKHTEAHRRPATRLLRVRPRSHGVATTPRRGDSLDELAERLSQASQLMAVLHEGLGRVLSVGGHHAVRLERLHQDLVQGYAACRLSVEHAATVVFSRARILRGVHEHLARFERLARAWLLLAAPLDDRLRVHLPVVRLRDLCELFTTEAAMRGVELQVGDTTDRPLIAPTRRAAWALAQRTDEAMHLAGVGGRLAVESTGSGQVTWEAMRADGAAARLHYDL
ncbi:MAG: hypothetical protein Q8S73_06180 [Deltaproteobacteria bacterium]|nr:hypothetical protein [Myxococcales bacterium]MDP3213671.1 hypothetical protein [Deltaproteobacteria bacterium]